MASDSSLFVVGSLSDKKAAVGTGTALLCCCVLPFVVLHLFTVSHHLSPSLTHLRISSVWSLKRPNCLPSELPRKPPWLSRFYRGCPVAVAPSSPRNSGGNALPEVG